MELKRLIAEDSKSALQSVRTTYGEDALIVSTNKIGSKTEVICAVDLLPDNEPFVDDTNRGEAKAEAPVVALETHDKGNGPFSASLNSVIDAKPIASDPGLANLVANIQQELLELRESVVAHVATNPHELNPQENNDTGATLNERSLRQQYGSLRALPLNEQKTWQGSHVFVGRPGSGKTSCIENLLRTHAAAPFALIALSSLQSDPDSATEHWLKLAKISQKYSVPCVHAQNYDQLERLISQLEEQHTILIDTQAGLLEDLQELQLLAAKHTLQIHSCIGADFAAETVAGASATLQSTIITRADLACELQPMFGALGRAQAQIVAVTGQVNATPTID